MGTKLSESDLALYRAVDEVLHYLWDPIGVSGFPEARDEYWTYLPVVFRLVKEGQDQETIANYLSEISTETIGMSLRREHDLKIAQILINWRKVIQDREN